MAKHKPVEEEEEDGYDEVEEELEEEEEAPKKNVNLGRPLRQQIKPRTPEVQEEPIERYQAYYQPEIVGIVDTTTKEVIIKGLPSVDFAKMEAIKLNILDRISIVSGV